MRYLNFCLSRFQGAIEELPRPMELSAPSIRGGETQLRLVEIGIH